MEIDPSDHRTDALEVIHGVLDFGFGTSRRTHVSLGARVRGRSSLPPVVRVIAVEICPFAAMTVVVAAVLPPESLSSPGVSVAVRIGEEYDVQLRVLQELPDLRFSTVVILDELFSHVHHGRTGDPFPGMDLCLPVESRLLATVRSSQDDSRLITAFTGFPDGWDEGHDFTILLREILVPSHDLLVPMVFLVPARRTEAVPELCLPGPNSGFQVSDEGLAASLEVLLEKMKLELLHTEVHGRNVVMDSPDVQLHLVHEGVQVLGHFRSQRTADDTLSGVGLSPGVAMRISCDEDSAGCQEAEREQKLSDLEKGQEKGKMSTWTWKDE